MHQAFYKFRETHQDRIIKEMLLTKENPFQDGRTKILQPALLSETAKAPAFQQRAHTQQGGRELGGQQREKVRTTRTDRGCTHDHRGTFLKNIIRGSSTASRPRNSSVNSKCRPCPALVPTTLCHDKTIWSSHHRGKERP